MSASEIPALKHGAGVDSDGLHSETLVNDCRVIVRRVEGPKARELFISVLPTLQSSEAVDQTEAAYQAVRCVLQSEGVGFESVVCETLFHRDLNANLKAVRTVRDRLVGAAADAVPVVTEIEQPPLSKHAWLELSIQAIVPIIPTSFEAIRAGSFCECPECERSQGVAVRIDDESRLYSGVLYGAGKSVYEQTRDMFVRAEEMLHQVGMDFGDVVRTWIYLPKIDRDYADLNRSRRDFFDERGVNPPPASTGIGAGLVEPHLVCLRVYAVKGKHALPKILMTTPTLNEAPSYGADFSRGMRVAESNREILHISGTASLDETGSTVHVGDFDAQANRMLVNVAALLEAQGACFSDVVSAITYVKNPADGDRLKSIFEARGYEGFAHVMVNAAVCRSELLCETEAIAIVTR
ncbi:MAG: Rid family hydrolase [Gammaproteobacteria bacterium]